MPGNDVLYFSTKRCHVFQHLLQIAMNLTLGKVAFPLNVVFYGISTISG